MADIAKNFIYGSSAIYIETTILDGQDTFNFSSDRVSCLVVKNITDGAVNINIDGDQVAPVSVSGIGDVDVTDGYFTGDILPGEIRVVRLSEIYEYLKGNISVTGGAGAQAYILEFL